MEWLERNSPEVIETISGADDWNLYSTAERIPFGVMVVEEPSPAVYVSVHDDAGKLYGFLENDTTTAIRSARSMTRSWLASPERLRMLSSETDEKDAPVEANV